jgi:hypothetical protein
MIMGRHGSEVRTLIPGAIILNPLMDSTLLAKGLGLFVPIGSGQERNAIAAWLSVLVMLVKRGNASKQVTSSLSNVICEETAKGTSN